MEDINRNNLKCPVSEVLQLMKNSVALICWISINVSFIVNFCLGKHSFFSDAFFLHTSSYDDVRLFFFPSFFLLIIIVAVVIFAVIVVVVFTFNISSFSSSSSFLFQNFFFFLLLLFFF